MKTRTMKRTATRNPDTKPNDHRPARMRAKELTAVPGLSLRILLVPVDFSAASFKALDFAVELAKPFGASVELLHVLDPMYAPGQFNAPKLRQLRREAGEDAKRRLAKVARRDPNGRLRHAVLNGVPYSVIVEKAARIKASMIVMGSRGRTGLGRFLVGSVAEKVIRHAQCPVLIVRDEAGNAKSSASNERQRSR